MSRPQLPDLSDVMLGFGIGMIVRGMALVSPALAWITAGVAFLALSYVVGAAKTTKNRGA